MSALFPALPRRARWFAAAIAVTAVASVGAQFLYLNELRGQTYAETAWDMARFFTILTNILVAWTWGRAALHRDGVYPPWIAALTLAIVMVGAVYHVLLSHLMEFEGLGWFADHGLHTVVPLACLGWWVAFGPKRRLIYSDLPIFALWPSIYLAYVLARGSFDGAYPYPFMDLTNLGAAAVATNLAGLTILLLLGGVVFVMIGRYVDR